MLNRTAPRRGKQNLAVRPLFCPYNGADQRADGCKMIRTLVCGGVADQGTDHPALIRPLIRPRLIH